VMSIKVVECGPFGCTLDRGFIESMDQIPEGYSVVRVQVSDYLTVYIDPVKDVKGRGGGLAAGSLQGYPGPVLHESVGAAHGVVPEPLLDGPGHVVDVTEEAGGLAVVSGHLDDVVQGL